MFHTHSLFTDRKFDIFYAGFALYVTTPMEFALATLLDLGLDRLEATIAAHLFTTVWPFGIFVADSAMRACKKNLR